MLTSMATTPPLLRCILLAAMVVLAGCAHGTEDQAKTTQFEAVFRDVLAGRAPTANISSQLRATLTPRALAQIDAYYSGFGALQRLQFLGGDATADTHAYHYAAIFERGKQAITFLADSKSDIIGFGRE